jgi:uncharacterized protein YciI
MKYAAVIEYFPDVDRVNAVRPRHREYLTSLLEQGKLACAGPFLDNYGALIVYEAATPEEAEAILKGDPFHSEGIFVRWTIRPWKTVFVAPGGLTTA